MRKSRHEYFMDIAKMVATRSTCKRAAVGAVLIDNRTNRIVACGFNGSIRGGVHCTDEGCLMHEGHCIRTIHAELNAILSLEHNYESLTLYTTHEPCLQCTKALVMANIHQVIYKKPYESRERDIWLSELNGKDFNIYPLSRF